jgi:hypothetical protein
MDYIGACQHFETDAGAPKMVAKWVTDTKLFFCYSCTAAVKQE